jgi:hypothetical protein
MIERQVIDGAGVGFSARVFASAPRTLQTWLIKEK